jgi:hypothetical protein
LIIPSGEVSEYLKNYLTPGDSHILGDDRVLIQVSDFGKLGTIICQDTHNLNFVCQARQGEVDINAYSQPQLAIHYRLCGNNADFQSH